jgi:hypothetical protein
MQHSTRHENILQWLQIKLYDSDDVSCLKFPKRLQKITREIKILSQFSRWNSSELLLTENFLRCIFLGAGLGVVDQFRGLRAHPMLRRLISSCGDALRTSFTWTLWPPSWTEAQNCCFDRDSYTANAEEHSEGNWIPLEHLTCHERSACWSCLALCRIDSIINKTFWVTLSYSVSSFILLYPIWKL